MSEVKRVGYRVREWREAIPMSHSQASEYIASGYVPTVKIGGMRLILESPEDFVARHREPAPAKA